MTDRFERMLELQLKLQQDHMAHGDPRDIRERLGADAWAEFMTWNAFALEDEVHEAMNEVGWKPWATSRHCHYEMFMKEMVDAFHFFMNMLLAATPRYDTTPAEIAKEFFRLYALKNQVNAERQQDGYTGTDKCPGCYRDFRETAKDMVPYNLDPAGQNVTKYCSKGCAMQHRPEFFDGERFIG